MAEIKAENIVYRQRGSGRTLQQVFDDDIKPPPPAFRETPEMDLGTEDISTQRYTSKEWHQAEVEHVWRKTWQVACRLEEIPNVGDYIVYDIVDDSLIVVRTDEDELRAYFNSCLHRGNALCLDQGHVQRLRCPFHGFTWSLDGQLRHIPSQWDFQHVDTEKYRLPEATLDTWGGFVFVNLDPDCAPLADYLEILPAHLDDFNFDQRYIAAHVSLLAPCNWKVAQEAFIEGYHVAETHYEKDQFGNTDPHGIAAFTDDVMIQYDIWPESRHVTRMSMAGGVASQHVAEHCLSDQQIVDTMLAGVPEARRPKVAAGQTARGVLADYNRGALGKRYGVDLAEASDTNVLDQVEYTLFPNFTFWPTLFAPLLYRFRPSGDNPDESIFEVFMLHPIPEDGRSYEVATERRLQAGETWADATELGAYGPVLDQDTPNLIRMTKGLKTSRKPGVTLANYQENRIRHFHRTLDEYLHIEPAN